MTSSPPPRSSSDNSIKCDLANQTFSNNNLTTDNHEDNSTLIFTNLCTEEPLDFSIKKCTKDKKVLSDDNESNGSISHPENNGINFSHSNSLEHSLKNKLKTPSAVPLKKIKYYGSYQAQLASKETALPKNCDLENVGPNTIYPIQKALISTEEFPPKVLSGVQTVPAFQVMPEYRGNSHRYICSPPLPAQFDSPAGPSNAYLSNTPILPMNYNFAESKKKHARPFKAYQFETNGINYVPKIPMNIGFPLDTSFTQTLINNASNEAFQEFRKKALAQKKLEREKAHKSKSETVNKYNTILNESNESNESNGDEVTQKTNIQPVSSTESTSRNISRKRSKALPDELKDEVYWEKRRKNNEAAKRSRDARRIKEDEIAIKATFFEQENMQLRLEIANLRKETATLKCLLYQCTNSV